MIRKDDSCHSYVPYNDEKGEWQSERSENRGKVILKVVGVIVCNAVDLLSVAKYD